MQNQSKGYGQNKSATGPRSYTPAPKRYIGVSIFGDESETVYYDDITDYQFEQLKKRPEIFKQLQTTELSNLDEPVHVFSVLPEDVKWEALSAPTPLMCAYNATKAFLANIWGRNLDHLDEQWYKFHPSVLDNGLPENETLGVLNALVAPYKMRVSEVLIKRGHSLQNMKEWKELFKCNPLSAVDPQKTHEDFLNTLPDEIKEQFDKNCRFKIVDNVEGPAVVCQKPQGKFGNTMAPTGHASFLSPRGQVTDFVIALRYEPESEETLNTPQTDYELNVKYVPNVLGSKFDGKEIRTYLQYQSSGPVWRGYSPEPKKSTPPTWPDDPDHLMSFGDSLDYSGLLGTDPHEVLTDEEIQERLQSYFNGEVIDDTPPFGNTSEYDGHCVYRWGTLYGPEDIFLLWKDLGGDPKDLVPEMRTRSFERNEVIEKALHEFMEALSIDTRKKLMKSQFVRTTKIKTKMGKIFHDAFDELAIFLLECDVTFADLATILRAVKDPGLERVVVWLMRCMFLREDFTLEVTTARDSGHSDR